MTRYYVITHVNDKIHQLIQYSISSSVFFIFNSAISELTLTDNRAFNFISILTTCKVVIVAYASTFLHEPRYSSKLLSVLAYINSVRALPVFASNSAVSVSRMNSSKGIISRQSSILAPVISALHENSAAENEWEKCTSAQPPITIFEIRLKCSSMRCCYYDKNLRC